ncbi:MAG: DUF5908 family protein [Segetibacter sp.]
MPVVVRELVIRATVNDNANAGSSASSGASANNAEERELLVKEIIEQVLYILEKRKRNKTCY